MEDEKLNRPDVAPRGATGNGNISWEDLEGWVRLLVVGGHDFKVIDYIVSKSSSSYADLNIKARAGILISTIEYCFEDELEDPLTEEEKVMLQCFRKTLSENLLSNSDGKQSREIKNDLAGWWGCDIAD